MTPLHRPVDVLPGTPDDTRGEAFIERPWLKSYPHDVPADVDVDAWPSLVSLFDASCERFRQRPAATCMGVTLTYAELHRQALAFSHALREEFRLVPGERVALMLPNSLQTPVAFFGTLCAGMQVVNCNPLYTAAELSFQLADSGAALVPAHERFAPTVREALPGTAVRHVVLTQLGDLFPPVRRTVFNFVIRHLRNGEPDVEGLAWHPLHEVLERHVDRPAAAHVAIGAGDVALVQYTGGTTGRPKGALLTHRNLIANVEQTVAWVGGALEPGHETVITALPLYHAFALVANLLVFIRLGGENVLVPDPRDLRSLVRLLHRTRFTAITGVNTLFDALLRFPGFAEVASRRAPQLKLAVAGGMPVDRGVADRWEKSFGKPLIEGYGLTEASPIVCANPVHGTGFTGKLGLPLPSTEVAILDPAGQALPIGLPGEICVRGPQVMKGYLGRQQDTAAVIDAQGWLHTGDLGTMDSGGWVEFLDRSKDVIVVSGFKAYAAEIEEVAKGIAGVLEAGAVAMPDERTGQAVALFVVPSDPGLTVADVRRHCELHLAAYKRPRHVEFRDALPMSALGKVLRRELRAWCPRRDEQETAVR